MDRKAAFILTILLAGLTGVTLLVWFLYHSPANHPLPDSDGAIPPASPTIPVADTGAAIATHPPDPGPVTETAATEPPAWHSVPDDLYQRWRENLFTSHHAHDRLIASLISRGEESREQLLRAYELAPEDLLVNEQLLQYCLYSPHDTLCSLPFRETLVSQDGDNGHLHALLAAEAYQNGQFTEAQHHLAELAGTKRASSYTPRNLEAITVSMQRQGIALSIQSLTSAHGIEAAIASTGPKLFVDMCKEQTATRWQSDCARAGYALARHGTSIFDQALGHRLVRMVEGNDTYQVELAKQIRELENSSQASVDQWDQLETQLEAHFAAHQARHPSAVFMPLEDQAWQTYLNLYRSEGEIAASRFILEHWQAQASASEPFTE